MKPKIGVMGSALGTHSEEMLEKAKQLGAAIADNDCIFFYGATIGLPLAAAKGAKEKGALVVGVSPATNEEEHREKYKYPTDACDAVVFTGFGFSGRNVVLVRSCDAIIVIGGKIGTMCEFTVAYVEERPIGILVGSGGFADKIKEYEQDVLKREIKTPIVYDADPKRLVEKVLQALEKARKD